MVLLSVQGMDVAQIAKVTSTSPDSVRKVIHNFNDDGFDSLYPKYAGPSPNLQLAPTSPDRGRVRTEECVKLT